MVSEVPTVHPPQAEAFFHERERGAELGATDYRKEVDVVAELLGLPGETREQIGKVVELAYNDYRGEAGFEVRGPKLGYHNFGEHIFPTIREGLIVAVAACQLTDAGQEKLKRIQNASRFETAEFEPLVPGDLLAPRETAEINPRLAVLQAVAWSLHDQKAYEEAPDGTLRTYYFHHEERIIREAPEIVPDLLRKIGLESNDSDAAIVQYLIAETCITKDRERLVTETWEEVQRVAMEPKVIDQVEILGATVASVDIGTTILSQRGLHLIAGLLQEDLEQRCGIVIDNLETAELPEKFEIPPDFPIRPRGYITEWYETNSILADTLVTLTTEDLKERAKHLADPGAIEGFMEFYSQAQLAGADLVRRAAMDMLTLEGVPEEVTTPRELQTVLVALLRYADERITNPEELWDLALRAAKRVSGQGVAPGDEETIRRTIAAVKEL